MISSKFPFSRALVTGASSGIGRELARHLARGGVRVAIAARRKPELDSLAEEMISAGGDAVVLPADLRLPTESIRVVEEGVRIMGWLDLVVANAGVGNPAIVTELSWGEIEQILMVNTVSSIALIRAALPGMIRRRAGYIAGISSLASYRGIPGNAAYSSSKAALSTFLEGVRVETRRSGIAVIDVHPGYVRTPLTARRKGAMPFIMDAEHAARRIISAIVRKKPVYNFPWQMALLMRMVRVLPPGLFDRLASTTL